MTSYHKRVWDKLLCIGCGLYIFYACLTISSSPFLCVFGDDRVTRYTGAKHLIGFAGYFYGGDFPT